MKTLRFFHVIFVFLIPSFSYAAVKGTRHDFSGNAWSGGQICIACHTPHAANQVVPNEPLWNHAVTTQTFTPYTSATMKAAVGQPNGQTKLCLSCHDGTIAINSFNGVVGNTFIAGKIGPNLLTGQGHWKHPFSITYDAALATLDTRVYNPTTRLSGLGGTVQQNLLFDNNQVQCTSCHDVHNKAGLGTLLRMNETALCNACHTVRM